MILDLAVWWFAAASAQEPIVDEPAPVVASPEAAAGEDPEEDPLSRYRVPFRVLANRTIGSASVPVAFDWRRNQIHIAATGSFLFELNTFNSARVGGMVRFPGPRTLVDVGVSYVRSWDSESSRQLALTPFRQPGRPSRLELDLGLTVPLAEGVVTAVPRVFPAVQMVFSAHFGFRYSLYPTGFAGLSARQVFQALVFPSLLDEEIANLEEARLDAMAVDPGRYTVMAGFTNDVYFARGVFVTPRVQFALPLVSFVSDSGLPFWVDVNLAIGVAL